jgi:hypothetical protein
LAHLIPDQSTPGAIRIGARSVEPECGRVRATAALAAYDRHGDALFSLAPLLCRDADRAADAVVATVTRACATAPDVAPDEERCRLAVDLWHRCAVAPAAPESVLPSQPYAHGPCGGQERAVLGLVLFGCHTDRQAAALIGVSAPSAALPPRSVPYRAVSVPTPRGARCASPPYPVATRQQRRGNG